MSTDETTAATCSFCGKTQDEVRNIIAGPTVYICDECVDLCVQILQEEASVSQETSPSVSIATNVVCSFCGKTQDEVHKIIAGPAVYICNECIDRSDDVLMRQAFTETDTEADLAAPQKPLSWSLVHWIRSLLAPVASRPQEKLKS